MRATQTSSSSPLPHKQKRHKRVNWRRLKEPKPCSVCHTDTDVALVGRIIDTQGLQYEDRVPRCRDHAYKLTVPDGKCLHTSRCKNATIKES